MKLWPRQFPTSVPRHWRKWLLLVLVAVLVIAVGEVVRQQWLAPSGEPPYSLILETPPRGRTELEEWAQAKDLLRRNRARYLLAVDSLQQNNPHESLRWLENLEATYRPMAAPILLLRAEAYQRAGNHSKAIQTWEALVHNYGNEPEAAVALLNLQQANKAIAQFPQHPAVVNYVHTQLQNNPDQVSYLKLVARYGLYLKDYGTYLEILRQRYPQELTPTDWEAIAFGYWEKMQYALAAAAYDRAPPTPLNRYRVGRGRQLSGDTAGAITAYQDLVQRFPSSQEAALGQLRLAQLAKTPTARLPLLATALELATKSQSSTIAAEVLLEQYHAYRQLGNRTAAQASQQKLLQTYGGSTAAAELRWELAQAAAQKGQWQTAQRWGTQIRKFNANSEIAPHAAFWLAKWLGDAGQPQAQAAAWRSLREDYPHSYYAWRAASLLREPVGTFTTLRYTRPSVDPSRRQLLPLRAGSITLQELYLLGQTQEAWQRWQWEFQNRVTPTAAEQLTDGLIRISVGDYLNGIFLLQNLFVRARREPDTAAFFRPIEHDPRFWYALYPLPYWEVVQKWSVARRLNPLLVMALIRQESRFEADIRSAVGATGLMQLMPETATWIADQLKIEDFSLEDPEDNVRLGTWYFDYTHNQYHQNTLLALASYNAGPGNVSDWLERFDASDGDRFIENIPFPETYEYVKGVLENYWNYLQLYSVPLG